MASFSPTRAGGVGSCPYAPSSAQACAASLRVRRSPMTLKPTGAAARSPRLTSGPHKQPRHGPLSRSRSRSYRGGYFAFGSPTRDPGSRSRRARPLAFALRYNSTSRFDQGEGFFFVVVALVLAGALVLALGPVRERSNRVIEWE